MERVRPFVFPCVLAALFGALITLCILRLFPTMAHCILPSGHFQVRTFSGVALLLDPSTGVAWVIQRSKSGGWEWNVVTGGPQDDGKPSDLDAFRRRQRFELDEYKLKLMAPDPIEESTLPRQSTTAPAVQPLTDAELDRMFPATQKHSP